MQRRQGGRHRPPAIQTWIGDATPSPTLPEIDAKPLSSLRSMIDISHNIESQMYCFPYLQCRPPIPRNYHLYVHKRIQYI